MLQINKMLGCAALRRAAFSTTTSTPRKVFAVTDSAGFMKEVLNNDVPVIVNFHADWCEPCKLLTPKLKELVLPMAGIDLAIVDVEKCPELVHAFEVQAVPAVLAVCSGLVVDKFIGLATAQNIEDFINRLQPLAYQKQQQEPEQKQEQQQQKLPPPPPPPSTNQ